MGTWRDDSLSNCILKTSLRVFVHRYRDSDAGIRADCVREMGVWLKRHPVYFLEGNYLRYVGWVLSDTVSSAALFAAKRLLSGMAPEYRCTVGSGQIPTRFVPKGRLSHHTPTLH